MAKFKWEQVQLVLVYGLLGATILTAIAAILTPRNRDRVATIVYPERVPLPDWDFRERLQWQSAELEGANLPYPGYEYRFEHGDRELLASASYQGVTEGNVSRLLQVYTSLPPATANITTIAAGQSPQAREFSSGAPASGSYGFYIFEGRASIAACINRSGTSTVTEQQFARQVSTEGIGPGRLIPWLLGRGDLFDRGCLFSRLSVPLHDDSETDTETLPAATDYPELEQAWLAWHQWWHSNYPPLRWETLED